MQRGFTAHKLAKKPSTPRQRQRVATSPVIACAAALLLCTGCLTVSQELSQTALSRLGVDPSSFRDAPACGENGFQTYLVQLIDVTPGEDAGAVQLPTSGPVPCQSSVELGFAASGRTYEARLFLFDRAASGLSSPTTEDNVPIGTVLVNEDGYPIAPRWLGECGDAAAQDSARTAGSDAGASVFARAREGSIQASLEGTRRFVSCRVWRAADDDTQ